MTPLAADLDPALLTWLRDDQAEVHAKHPVVRSAMPRNPLARLEDREERGAQPGDAAERFGGGRTAREVGLAAQAVAVEHEGLPAIIAGDRGDLGGDVLEVRQSRALRQQRLEFLADRRRRRLELWNPGEDLGSEERSGPDGGGGEQAALQAVDEALGEPADAGGWWVEFGRDVGIVGDHRLTPRAGAGRR